MKIWKWGFWAKLWGNKNLEVDINLSKPWSYFSFSVSWNRKQDHAGFHSNFELFGITLWLSIYDNRHWDDEKACWSTTLRDES